MAAAAAAVRPVPCTSLCLSASVKTVSRRATGPCGPVLAGAADDIESDKRSGRVPSVERLLRATPFVRVRRLDGTV